MRIPQYASGYGAHSSVRLFHRAYARLSNANTVRVRVGMYLQWSGHYHNLESSYTSEWNELESVVFLQTGLA